MHLGGSIIYYTEALLSTMPWFFSQSQLKGVFEAEPHDTGQHTFYGIPVEGGEDGWVEVSPLQLLHKVYPMVSLFCQGRNVQGPGQVVGKMNIQELSALYRLHCSSIDNDGVMHGLIFPVVNHQLFSVVRHLVSDCCFCTSLQAASLPLCKRCPAYLMMWSHKLRPL